jgi:glycosyltransferase involved in cell wall biosynthesis
VRIGIDASCWTNKRGYGRYTRELVAAILEIDAEHSYTLFLDDQTERQCTDLPARAGRVIVPATSSAADAASAEGHRSVWDLWAMSRAVSSRRSELDLFYFPSVYSFFPVPRRLNTLITIHDTIAERHPALIFPHWRNRLFWKIKVAWALRQAKVVATVSETARSAVRNQFGLADSRLRVVSDAVGAAFQPTDDSPERRRLLAARGIEPGQRFILYVGGISPHKSIETLIDAHAQLAMEGACRDLRLVLVGDYKHDVFFSSYDALRPRAASSSIFTGFVPDAELPHWYSAAEAVVLPSVDEGFGLPAIEAMACGTPVLASRAGALPEVVGDAGLLFEPRDTTALIQALRSVVTDATLRQSLSSKGLAQAAKYSWRASARAAIEMFEEVGRRRPGR